MGWQDDGRVPGRPSRRAVVRPTAPTPAATADRYLADGHWGAPAALGAIEQTAWARPDRVAVIDRAGTFSYAELSEAVLRACHRLEAWDVGPGEPVVAVMPNWFESVVLHHAVLRCRAVSVPLSPHARMSEISHAVHATGARVLVLPATAPHDGLARHLLGTPPVEVVGWLHPVRSWDEPSELRSLDPTIPTAPPAHDDVAVVLFTSGSTSDPKGVLHTHDSLSVANANLTRAMDLGEHDVHYVVSPVAHVTGLMQGMHMPFENGASCVLDDRWHPERSLHFLERHGATFMGGAPVFYEGLLGARRTWDGGPSSLAKVCCGGAPVREELVQAFVDAFGARMARAYGSSECPGVSVSAPDDDPARCSADDGVIVPGVETRLAGGGAASDQEGELLVRSPSLFQGYLDPAQNEGALDDEGWFRTGDVVRIDRRRLRVTGRVKEIAIRKGENISLAEVESALAGWAAIGEVAAFSRPDPDTGERVAVAVVPAGIGPPTHAGMVDHLRASGFATQKFPEEIVVWPSPLPRTASGKVDRSRIAAEAEVHPSDTAARLSVEEVS